MFGSSQDNRRVRSPDPTTSRSPRNGGKPISFRTDVNRQKTKRWVEAKTASYDGNDWGEDEWGKYDDDDHPESAQDAPAPKNPSPAQPSKPSCDLSPHISEKTPSSTTDSNVKPLPFIRPADIYQRMQEERLKQRQLAQSTHSRESGSPVQSSPSSLTQGGEERASNDNHGSYLSTRTAQTNDVPQSQSPNSSLQATPPPVLGLPEVEGLSRSDPNITAHSVQPSTSDSVSRPHSPNSPSVNLIMANSGSNKDETLTPVKRLNETSSIDREATEPASLSTSDPPDNFNFSNSDHGTFSPPLVLYPESDSQSKSAELEQVEGPADSAAQPQTDAVEATQLSDSGPYLPTSSDVPPRVPEKDLPSPLKISTGSSKPAETNASVVPIIVFPGSTDNSPSETESDRLREEIMQSLSRENSTTFEPDRVAVNPSTDVDTVGTGNEKPMKQLSNAADGSVSADPTPEPHTVPDSNVPASTSLVSKDLPSIPPVVEEQSRKPKLSRRFSWESTSNEGSDGGPSQEPLAEPKIVAPFDVNESASGIIFSPPADITLTAMATDVPAATDENARDLQEVPAAAPSVSEETPKAQQPDEPSPNLNPEAVPNRSMSEDVGAMHGGMAVPPSDEPTQGQQSAEPVLLGFRDIVGIAAVGQRVQAFNSTRNQFASIDTGLAEWLQLTIKAYPEHADMIEQNLMPSSSVPQRRTPSKGRFPSFSHARRPSATLTGMMNKQNVEQRGKELLHSAGVLGGKAGDKAKGLFAKGRSKFRGNDKVDA